MICKWCGCRYADYPGCDFYFEREGVPGLYPRSEAGYQRRREVYANEEEGDCGCREYAIMRDRMMKRRSL
jgi:hypothetical protein